MDRQDICILLNSTPKYFYLLPLQLTMIRRYAPELKWPIYFATEALDNPMVSKLILEFQVKIISLSASEESFLESRQAALRKLPPSITYVLPLQEDFLLDRKPDYSALTDALFILDTDRTVSSLRLTPCPGHSNSDLIYTKDKPWRILGPNNSLVFTYQATLWRRMDLQTYFNELLAKAEKVYGSDPSMSKKRLHLIGNIAEVEFGQQILLKVLPNVLHLCWPRVGGWSNAVYLCPWPYRPTAVTRGNLEPFAKELFLREGVKLDGDTTGLL